MQTAVDTDRARIKQFLLSAAEHAGTSLTGLAQKAGLAPSTVTRFVNEDAKHIPSTRTLAKIAEASGYAMPDADRPSKAERIDIVVKLADALAIDLVELIAASGISQQLAVDALAFTAAFAKLPARAQLNIFEMVTGMAETAVAADQQVGPAQSGRRRERA